MNNFEYMQKAHKVKCPLCEQIRLEYFAHAPKIMPRIYCDECLEKMRRDDDAE
jgi:late competence protein required for DNA uptake (superfamily II DNA/RNA helicase)